MKILVILASYNGEKYILEQLESILSQVAVDLDIMVFDDQSTDDTVTIVKELCKIHNNITLVNNKEQSGSAAKNFCNSIISLPEEIISGYDYIALSDQDDIWLQNKLEKSTITLYEENADLYASNLILWQEDLNKKSIVRKDYKLKEFDYLFEGASAGCTYVFTSSFANHLKIIFSQIDFENWLFFSHDWLIYFIARLDNYKVIIDKNAGIIYRIHSENVHGQLNTNSLNSFVKRLDFILNGWYFKQLEGFTQLLNPNSIEYNIYYLYSKNLFTRFWILIKYNSQLIRSKRKFVKFAIVSILPRF